jgi:hypothetical protein
MEESDNLKKGLLFLALILVAAAVIGLQTGAYLYFQKLLTGSPTAAHYAGSHCNNSTSDSNHIEVCTLINFGNSTTKWFNETQVPSGWNFYQLTVYIASGDVNATWYSNYQEHFITGIYGVLNRGQYYWGLWLYCNKDQAWLYAQLGADSIHLSDGQIVAWYFEANPNSPLPPVNGAKVVSACSA